MGTFPSDTSKINANLPIMLLKRLLPQNILRPHHRLSIEPRRPSPHPRRHHRLRRHPHPTLHIARQFRETGPALAIRAVVFAHVFELDGGGFGFEVGGGFVVEGHCGVGFGGELADAEDEGAEGGEGGAGYAEGLLDDGEDGGCDDGVGDVGFDDLAEGGDADDGGDAGAVWGGRRGQLSWVIYFKIVLFCSMAPARIEDSWV